MKKWDQKVRQKPVKLERSKLKLANFSRYERLLADKVFEYPKEKSSFKCWNDNSPAMFIASICSLEKVIAFV